MMTLTDLHCAYVISELNFIGIDVVLTTPHNLKLMRNFISDLVTSLSSIACRFLDKFSLT